MSFRFNELPHIGQPPGFDQNPRLLKRLASSAFHKSLVALDATTRKHPPGLPVVERVMLMTHEQHGIVFDHNDRSTDPLSHVFVPPA